jgi:cytosine/adenosine deaminase-related metal-dependent hydrolase
MTPQRLLVKNGTVLSLDPTVGNFLQADMLVEDGRIAAVGPNLSAADAEVIDASQRIVMPGFIDSHRHTWQGLIRNIGADQTLGEYFANVHGVISSVYRPQDVYVGNLVSVLGAIEAGITTLLDWSHIQITPEHSDAAIRALDESGMRAIFAYGTPNPSAADWWTASGTNHEDNLRRIARDYFASKDQLLTLARAPRGPEARPMAEVAEDWALARELDIRITVHAGVRSYGTVGTVADMGRAGLLGPDTTYIHCNDLSDEAIQMIAASGGTVSISSPIEMQMGHGTPPFQRFLEHGLRPSLSVDVETAIAGDMFTQMRSALALQRGAVHARGLAGEDKLSSLLSSRDVLEFATIEGAKANALDHKVGTLTPGKDADFILLRADRLNVMPINDPIGAVVTAMDTSNVDSVFVAGRALKRNGELVNVDLERIRRLAYESRDYVIAKSGYSPPAI